MEELIRLSHLAILQQTDYLKAEIDALRPLSKEQEDRIMQKFRLDWNFHSNAIEGNSLDYGETVAFLMHGITAKGKPFKDYLDIKGHNEAIDFLLELIRNNDDLTEKDIRSLHQLLLVEPYEVKAETPDGNPTTKLIELGRYKTSPNHVKTETGAIHYYATPEETPIKMHELMEWHREAKVNPAIHPVVLAAIFHHRFVSIHPFDDGNGRMTRLLMNLMLMQAHYPPVVLKHQERGTYYLTLSQADTGDDEPFVEFIADNVVRALELYLKGAKGESLDEPSDLDKELALLKKELEGDKGSFSVKRSVESQNLLYKESMKPLLERVRLTVAKFADLFLYYFEGEQRETIDTEGRRETFYIADASQMYENTLAYSLASSTELEQYIKAFRLIEFRQQYNTFNVAIILNFSFDDYYYYITYGLDGGETKKLKRLYSEQLYEYETSQIADTIGRYVLNFIKQHRQNGDTVS